MVDGDVGDHGVSAISLVIVEDRPELEDVIHQLQALEDKIVLVVKLKRDSATTIVVARIIGPRQSAGNKRRIVERTILRRTAEKHVVYAPPRTLVI